MREWVLAEQNYDFIRSQKWDAVILPAAATEPHNLHMPYGTDIFEAEGIADRACEIAWKKGARVLRLPAIPFGVNTNYFGLKNAYACNLNPSTLYAVITDIVDAMERQGIRKMVLLNGHGGNELKPVIRELHHRSKMFLCLCDFWRLAPDKDKEIFDTPGDHAGELESSLGLAFFPQFMKMENADKGSIKKTRFDAVNKGWITITRPWHLATSNSGAGDPSKATAEKGKQYMDVITKRLGEFLIELAAAPMDEKFPY
jgi:creatinine amidohydrolase